MQTYISHLQKSLPLAYLYLVILGILKESLFYHYFDINILHFSGLMDIIISPIGDLIQYPILGISVILFLFLVFGWWHLHDSGKIKQFKFLKAGNKSIDLSQVTIIIGIGLLTFFAGVGMGAGKKTADNMRQQKLSISHHLTNALGETKEIHLIGSNSLHYFYVEKGTAYVQITPLNNVVKLGVNGAKQQ
jgi:hypothetical protein